MNCFRHHERGAVGICKSCGKGLCSVCAAELPDGLACKGSCEARVDLLNRIITRNSQTLSATRQQVKIAGASAILLGVVYAMFGVWAYLGYRQIPLACFSGLSGIIFIIFGLGRLSRKAQYPRAETEASDTR